MRLGWLLLALGWVLALGGGWAAHLVQTSGGTEVRDVRFPAADGAQLSGLLYLPAEVTPCLPCSSCRRNNKASPALGAGRPVVTIWSAASCTRNSKAK